LKANKATSRELKQEVQRAVKLAKECLSQAGHSRKLSECPICNHKYAQDLIERQRRILFGKDPK